MKKKLISLMGVFGIILKLSSCTSIIHRHSTTVSTNGNSNGGVDAVKSSAKDITEFVLAGVSGIISESNILVPLPYGTNVNSLASTLITHTGASVSPGVGDLNNFNSSVPYTVTAADGSTKTYTVTVNVALSPAKDITEFVLAGVPGMILEPDIFVTLPYVTDLISLAPTTITHTGASVSPGVGDLKNFNSSVPYTVTAADGSTKTYMVTVTLDSPLVGNGDTFTVSGVNFNMVYVPGGLTFKAGFTDSTPTTVANAYWIGETQVTYELWYAVKTWATAAERGANIYTFGNSGREGNDGTIGAAPTAAKQEPVTTITWRDSMIWINALTEWYNAINFTDYTCAYYTDAGYTTPIRTSTTSSTITGSTLGSQDAPYVKADASGFRMMASMEYELAAKYKGPDSLNGAYQWPVGSGNWWTPGSYASGATAANTIPIATGLVGWNSANAGGATHDVKGRAPNALVLYDMSGNIWQWSFDWLPGYVGSRRVRRGGSWNEAANSMQSGYEDGGNPYYTNVGYGLRFARNAL